MSAEIREIGLTRRQLLGRGLLLAGVVTLVATNPGLARLVLANKAPSDSDVLTDDAQEVTVDQAQAVEPAPLAPNVAPAVAIALGEWQPLLRRVRNGNDLVSVGLNGRQFRPGITPFFPITAIPKDAEVRFEVDLNGFATDASKGRQLVSGGLITGTWRQAADLQRRMIVHGIFGDFTQLFLEASVNGSTPRLLPGAIGRAETGRATVVWELDKQAQNGQIGIHNQPLQPFSLPYSLYEHQIADAATNPQAHGLTLSAWSDESATLEVQEFRIFTR